MSVLKDKMILVGVCGGAAAYRSAELVRLLVKEGARVQVVMTDFAARLVGPLMFQALSGRPTEVGHGGLVARAGMEHIDFARESDVIVVAPVTANTLAKIAHGLADNLLTTTLLASTCPVVLAPAMNSRMWQNPMTAQNVARLTGLERFHMVGPAQGLLACGEDGLGRMSQPAEILHWAKYALHEKDLTNKRILVTAGPTREAIDPVRYISNRSSGKMGYALAEVAALRGAQVVLISGPTALSVPFGVCYVPVLTAAEMAAQVDAHADKTDAVVMAAAVADFTPKTIVKQKIKKTNGVPEIQLVPTQDILRSLGQRAQRPRLIGFAAETGDPLPSATSKLQKKGLDLVVANDVSAEDAGFDVDTNRVHLVSANGVESLPTMSKHVVSSAILDRLVQLFAD